MYIIQLRSHRTYLFVTSSQNSQTLRQVITADAIATTTIYIVLPQTSFFFEVGITVGLGPIAFDSITGHRVKWPDTETQP